ncbi:alpha-tocopherol transfer protein-like isoform X2 [Prorops nasuta]|uniref:alpha-tocopherol transfer protein-like isoform X2 n=1 Tax=Prorops nasuta TaxID=863751 RepID=UPI0034CF69B2
MQGEERSREASEGTKNDEKRTIHKEQKIILDDPKRLLSNSRKPHQRRTRESLRDEELEIGVDCNFEEMPEEGEEKWGKDGRVTRKDEELILDFEEPTDEETLEFARTEVGESDEVKCQTLQELRDLIYERGECLPNRMDDEFLIRFLRARNFNIYRAHRLMVRYFEFKEAHPEIHRGVNPLQLSHLGDDDVMTVPAYRTPCGRRMMIYRLGNWDPRKFSIDELFKGTVIILEIGILEPRAQILGGVVVFDLKGITMNHVWTITPQVASMVISLMVTSHPMKTHAIHILNQSWVFDAMFAVFKPLLNAKMKEKIFFHGSDMASFHRHISPEYLPKMYGGIREELPYHQWFNALCSVPKVVKEMYALGYTAPEEVLRIMED